MFCPTRQRKRNDRHNSSDWNLWWDLNTRGPMADLNPHITPGARHKDIGNPGGTQTHMDVPWLWPSLGRSGCPHTSGSWEHYHIQFPPLDPHGAQYLMLSPTLMGSRCMSTGHRQLCWWLSHCRSIPDKLPDVRVPSQRMRPHNWSKVNKSLIHLWTAQNILFRFISKRRRTPPKVMNRIV